MQMLLVLVRYRLTLQRLAVSFAVLGCVLLLRLVWPSFFLSSEHLVGDWLWRLMARSEDERRVVIVDIDESSIARIGPWPWPREKMAELVAHLHAAKAGEVLLDVVFPDPKPGDASLAAAMRSGPTVPAQLFSLTRNPDIASGFVNGALPGLACPPEFAQAQGYIANDRLFATSLTGHLSPRIDPDGTIRRVPGLACMGDKAFPALSVAAFLRSANDPFALTLSRQTGLGNLGNAPWRLTHSQLGISFPLDHEGNIQVGYGLTRKSFASLPAADVIEGRFPAEWVRGAWVLVGATAFGLGDAVRTPQGGLVGGVEVHAQAIAAGLDGRVPYTPVGAGLIQFVVVSACIFLLVFGASLEVRRPRQARWRVWLIPLGGLVLAAGMIGLHGVLLWRWSWWLGFAEGTYALALAGFALGTFEHARVRLERERLLGHFSSYLPAKVAALLAEAEPSSQIDAERCEITALVADIRNFSAYVEGRPPEESGSLLHAFYTGCAQLVKAHGGEIDHFAGDSVIALWNSRESGDKGARLALDCAEAMQNWFADRFPGPPPPGLEPLALGIGIETGTALTGSFGPVERRTYTALGESVTVARRLEALTADVARPILIGEGAAAGLNDDGLDFLGLFLLEGLRRTHRVWSPPLIDYSQAPESTGSPLSSVTSLHAERRRKSG